MAAAVAAAAQLGDFLPTTGAASGLNDATAGAAAVLKPMCAFATLLEAAAAATDDSSSSRSSSDKNTLLIALLGLSS